MPIKIAEESQRIMLYSIHISRTLDFLEDENGFKLVSGDLETGEF